MAKVVVSWSGGIDSTALIAQLLHNRHEVYAVALGIYGGEFAKREAAARRKLIPILKLVDGNRFRYCGIDMHWIWNFSPDGIEIPRRNRIIMDYLIAQFPDHKHIGMGEYIGADTWVVQDHVGAADADARALAAYLYQEYGLSHRLWTLSDFGEARYKKDRLRLGEEIAEMYNLPYLMRHTTNCLHDVDTHCGACYKCVERAAAFDSCDMQDQTEYTKNPREHAMYTYYLRQMRGERVSVPSDVSFANHLPMPRR